MVSEYIKVILVVKPRTSGRVDPWLQPQVWCNPDQNHGSYSLSDLESRNVVYNTDSYSSLNIPHILADFFLAKMINTSQTLTS